MTGIIDKALRMGEGHELNKLRKVVKQTNALEDEISSLTDEELKGQTEKFRKALKDGKKLDDIMPEAFATVREASKEGIRTAPL